MPNRSLLRKLHSHRNLSAAWQALQKRPHSHGLSGQTIEQFGQNVTNELKVIRRELKSNNYRFSPVKGTVKYEKRLDGKVKPRPLRSSDIRDRVVQKALARIIEPRLIKIHGLLNAASFGYVAGKGIRDALLKIVSLYRSGNPVVLEADLEDFFGSVDQAKLLQDMIFPSLEDRTVDDLISKGLAQEVGNRDELSDDESKLFPEANIGIPQGGGLSPLFANVYLSTFDKKMLEAGYGLIRYADDFVVMCKDEKEAAAAYALAKNILEDQLHLKLHPLGPPGKSKTSIRRLTQSGVEFLGTGYNGNTMWPAHKNLGKLFKRIQEITEYDKSSKLSNMLYSVKNIVQGWVSAYCHTSLESHIIKIDNLINLRVGLAAYRMSWKSKPGPLSARQRESSGIPDTLTFLKEVRAKLKTKFKDAFFGVHMRNTGKRITSPRKIRKAAAIAK